MDWMMPVNDMLKEDISKINYKLMPPQFKGDIRSIRIMQDSLSRLIDLLGEQSSAAQGLNRIITTADKLRNSTNSILYLMKDAKAKGGKGEVIGLLKMGRKHLFLFNEHDKVCEMEPLCVLDFFVLKDRQRAGYGKILFDYMLQDLQVDPKELAIDGPSMKMEQFLQKNYGINKLIKQNNNFAIAPEFFKLVPEISKSGLVTPVETGAVGRFTAPKPPSAIATVIHGGVHSYYDDNNSWDDGKSANARQRQEAVTANNVVPSAPPESVLEPEAQAQSEPKPEPQPAPEPQPGPDVAANNTKSCERPSTLRVEPVGDPAAPAPAPAPAAAISPAGSTFSRRDSQLTDQGYFDVKFYHNKLW